MPVSHCRFYRRVLPTLAVAGIASVLFLTPSISAAADWPACEKAKLRALKLERGNAMQKTSKSKKSRGDDRRQRAEEIDTWLWKNCRDYSYELRQLEQDHM